MRQRLPAATARLGLTYLDEIEHFRLPRRALLAAAQGRAPLQESNTAAKTWASFLRRHNYDDTRMPPALSRRWPIASQKEAPHATSTFADDADHARAQQLMKFLEAKRLGVMTFLEDAT